MKQEQLLPGLLQQEELVSLGECLEWRQAADPAYCHEQETCCGFLPEEEKGGADSGKWYLMGACLNAVGAHMQYLHAHYNYM